MLFQQTCASRRKSEIGMMLSSSLVCLVICILPTLTLAHEVNDSAVLTNERHLYKHLLEGYEKALRPVRNQSETVTVSIELVLRSIDDLNEETQVMRSTCWIRMSWVDIQLTWTPNDFGGVENMNLPVQNIWTPDIKVYNSISNDLPIPLTQLALVDNEGNVAWSPPVTLETQCLVDLSFFPFDKQTCIIKIGSWTYSGDKLDIKEMAGGSLDTASYTNSPQWDLLDTSATRNQVYYSGLPGIPYVDVTFTFFLQRRAGYSLHLFLAPSVTLSLVIPVVFAMPAGSTEKISLGVGVLISHVLLLGEVIKFVPAGHHQSVPLMAHFFVANVVVVALSLVISTIIVNCWSRGLSRRTGPPAVFKRVFLNQVITKILCIDFSQHSSADGAGIDDPVISVSSDRTSISDDRARMMRDKERLLAASEWRHLADVMDRLFFILYIVVVTVMCLGFLKYM